jgi:hypothetical protein
LPDEILRDRGSLVPQDFLNEKSGRIGKKLTAGAKARILLEGLFGTTKSRALPEIPSHPETDLI